ncbi:hypothetical protein QJQ45_025224 [Haematococcus lacustris]|nr:hypothetical protein QJQ45_025224 [Haematococcus lacustris]
MGILHYAYYEHTMIASCTHFCLSGRARLQTSVTPVEDAQHKCALRRSLQATAAPQPSTTAAGIKAELLTSLRDTNRGIFGLPAAKKNAILGLVTALEAETPVPSPTSCLELCAGRWRLLYSTITITGVKRTKLGLREFIRLGDFVQEIDTVHAEAINTVDFNVAQLSMVGGALTVRAGYEPVGPARVAITFKDASLRPPQLQKLFEANYDLLLSIFNPEGWLDITYLDQEHRVGRDDKGNVFVLEKLS